jgi:PAS domain S-box-containing protein
VVGIAVIACLALRQRNTVQDKVYKIGWEIDPPAQFEGTGEPTGLNVEIVRAAAKRSGIKLQWVRHPEGPDAALGSKAVDLWPLITITEERKKRIFISDPYQQTDLLLVALKSESSIQSDDLAGKTISIQDQPINLQLLQKLFPQAKPLPKADTTKAIAAACRGESQGALLDGFAILPILLDGTPCPGQALKMLPTGTSIELGLGATFEARAAATVIREEIGNMVQSGDLTVLMRRWSRGSKSELDALEATIAARRQMWWYRAGVGALAMLLAFSLWSAFEYREARNMARRAERENNSQRLRMEGIIDSSIDGIVTIDDQSRILVFNPAAEKLFRCSKRQILGVSIERLIPAHLGGITENWVTTGLRSDGEEFPMEVTVSEVSLSERKLLTVTCRDISEKRRAEAEGQRLQAQLQQAQKMESVGRLAGGVAHDFNNLLTVINGYSDFGIAKLSAGDPLRVTMTEIRKAGERAAALTRQLLAFSRKQVLQPRALDLNRLLEEMRPMLERLVGEDIEVRVALHAGRGTIHADAHQLEQVVMNLVVNARDAMPRGGKLLVETANVARGDSYVRSHPEARVGQYVMLAVSDTGIGIDEELKNRIFEPFFTTKGVGKGTGLGLAMVQGIVAQSGGYVEVYSEKGEGTTFKIYLPERAEVVADTARPAALTAMGGTETVLVVEDQEEVREFTVKVLRGYGYRVIDADTANDALRYCEREHDPIHLVLTDVVMPNIGGRELANRLREVRPQTKVLFMSGYTDDVILHNGTLEQGVPFIQKPFSPEELARKVRAVVAPPVPEPCILVADDEVGVRGFLRGVLERGGYEVIEATNGTEAIEQARAGLVDLVIMDLVMPQLKGLETIQALRQDVPGVGIIAMSGTFGGQFLNAAEALGADATLIKPIRAELLLARVAEVLKSRR